MFKKNDYINFLRDLYKIEDGTEKSLRVLERAAGQSEASQSLALIIANKQRHKKMLEKIMAEFLEA